MKQYKVEITKEAFQDMEDIYNYIAIDFLAPDNAMGQYNRIADEILRGRSPRLCGGAAAQERRRRPAPARQHGR